MPSTYADIPEENRYPSLVEHKYGKGSAVYISGNFAETTANVRNIPDYTYMLRAFCDHTARPVVVSDDPGLYEVVLRRQENRFVLHVINLTGTMKRPIDVLTPLYGLSFDLDLNGFGVDKADYSLKALRGSGVSGVKVKDGKISFKLDKLDDYEVVVIE